MLATISSNIWSRLKSPTIKILCCIRILFVNKINLSIKEPTGPGARYTITNKKVSLFISHTIRQYFHSDRDINYFSGIYLAHLVTQSQDMLGVLMVVFPIIQDFINMFNWTTINVGFSETK